MHASPIVPRSLTTGHNPAFDDAAIANVDQRGVAISEGAALEKSWLSPVIES
jgi:hypothetical protein